MEKFNIIKRISYVNGLVEGLSHIEYASSDALQKIQIQLEEILILIEKEEKEEEENEK